MKKERRKGAFFFRKGDLIAVAAVLLLAALIFAAFAPRGDAEGAYAQVYQNGALLFTVSLDRDREFPVTGAYSNTVTVKGGKIAITRSDCPGEDCVHSGWLDSPDRSIVCLPNALEIRVVSGSSDVDFVVG